ncbi:hypothetical protein B9Z55_026103 [Caenorhabditis nigoni]|nr:hypothetical protein B9Z55_026103 [Caenorhabditis nigoni]
MTLNEYNTTPSPPFTPPCYAPMTPVSFGSMYSDPDTPSSDLLSLSPNKSAEYSWLTANGSMSEFQGPLIYKNMLFTWNDSQVLPSKKMETYMVRKSVKSYPRIQKE